MTQHLRFLEAMKLQGFDEPLQRPFFRNTPWFAAYNLMPYPGSSFGDLEQHHPGRPQSTALMLEKFALLQQDPYLLSTSATASAQSTQRLSAITTLARWMRCCNCSEAISRSCRRRNN